MELTTEDKLFIVDRLIVKLACRKIKHRLLFICYVLSELISEYYIYPTTILRDIFPELYNKFCEYAILHKYIHDKKIYPESGKVFQNAFVYEDRLQLLLELEEELKATLYLEQNENCTVVAIKSGTFSDTTIWKKRV